MIETNYDLVEAATEVAKKYKTLYVNGCFGAPLNEKNKSRYCTNTSYNKKPERTQKIMEASDDTFGFDCVCFIKGLLWGWSGNINHVYGGAVYCSNGVPDISEDGMLNACSHVSADFSNIEIGEYLWLPGHAGIYIGDGLAVECSPKWNDGVQITAVENIGQKIGFNARTWNKHGKLPYIQYKQPKSVEEIAQEVIQGKWGAGEARKMALARAGYNYKEVQAKVDEILKSLESKWQEGQEVMLIHGSKYYDGKIPASWVYDQKLYIIKLLEDDNAVVSTVKSGAITGIVHLKDLVLFGKTYDVIVTASNLLNVRQGPSTGSAIIKQIRRGTKHAIFEQKNGWGHIQNSGWISLQYAARE